MKTAEEIKKGLSCCGLECADWTARCRDGCPYYPECDFGQVVVEDALAYIQQLEAERDAMIEEMKNAHSCFACKKFYRNGGECCGCSVCLMRDFEWRGGVQKEG